jgi:hypothetical protein
MNYSGCVGMALWFHNSFEINYYLNSLFYVINLRYFHVNEALSYANGLSI